MSATTPAEPLGSPAAEREVGVATRFRSDIQGLRAVAVLAVLGFHAGVPYFSGGYVGVDVFFVISGFLITGLLLREIRTTGTVNLTQFWARRAKRLLPATAVVLTTVALLTVWFLPVTHWRGISGDLFASTFYVVNWRLAGQSVDYLLSDEAPSPLQHFWSLAVEEQFYVAWPLVIVALLVVHHRFRLSLMRTMLAGILVIAVPSLAWSIYLTVEQPGMAYFATTTRAWELAIGAVVALTAHRLMRLPRVFAQALGIAGLLAITWSVLAYDKATAFPGYTALLPTLGTAAVIISGSAGWRGPTTWLLSTKPMTWIGGLSYSLYLWHWPLIVVGAYLWGRDDRLPTHLGVLVVVFSVLPAWLTFRFVENPLHHATALRVSWRALGVGALCMALGAGAAGTVTAAIPEPPRQGSVEVTGADALNGDGEDEIVDEVEAMMPTPLTASDDRPKIDGNFCIDDIRATTPRPCTYGVPDAGTVIAVVGDSKMHQWLPALQYTADRNDWRLVTFLKSACPLVTVPVERADERYRECEPYNEARLERLVNSDEIDIVITSQRFSSAYIPRATDVERVGAMVGNLVQIWDELEDAGKRVVVLYDNPSPTLNVIECVSTNNGSLSECAFDRDDAFRLSGAVAQSEAVRASRRVEVIDLSDWICLPTLCPAVIGNTLVYREGSHITGTYIRTLGPRLEQALLRVLDRD
jgi:peptidoglycan/LPS O-acetylase OafA/YrhL